MVFEMSRFTVILKSVIDAVSEAEVGIRSYSETNRKLDLHLATIS